MRHTTLFFTMASLLLLSSPASAQVADSGPTSPGEELTETTDESTSREVFRFAIAPDWREDILWQPEFRGIRTWEYPVTAGAFGLAFGMRFIGPDPPPTLRGPALFDRPLMNAWVSDDPGVRARWSSLSDSVWTGSMIFRALDSVITPGLIHGEWKTAGRMLMMDLETFGMMSAAIWTTQKFVGRTRPIAEGCDDPDTSSGFCGSEENRSFISGHVATSTTAAALTCTHHLNMRLLGPKWAGIAICGVAGTLTTLNGIGRIVNEAHYPTDVLLGMTLGIASGWLIPQTLHYGWGTSSSGKKQAKSTGFRWTIMPAFVPNGASSIGGFAVSAQF